MFKEVQLIFKYHKFICGGSIILSILYILDVIQNIGDFNIKWVVVLLLLFGSVIIYEIYMKPRSRRLPDRAHPGLPPRTPQPLPRIPRPVPKKPKIVFIPANPKTQNPPNKENTPKKEDNIELADDTLPQHYAEKLGLKIPKSDQKEKSAFENFGFKKHQEAKQQNGK